MFFYSQVPLNIPFKKLSQWKLSQRDFSHCFCESHIGLAHSLNLCKDENELFSSSGKQLCRIVKGSGKEKPLLGKQSNRKMVKTVKE